MIARRPLLLLTAGWLGLTLSGSGAVIAADAPPPPPVPEAPAAAPPPAPAPEPASGALAAPVGPLPLRIGSRGPLVRELQRALRRRGVRVAADGEFGPKTKRAVRTVQLRRGLRPTGRANRSLLRALGVRLADLPAGSPGGTSAYLESFPVAGPHKYTDDWGAPRAQGGHEGTDILADRFTPIVAAAPAVVIRLTRAETGLGGVYLWLRRENGIQFYYAHMQAIADGLGVGDRVTTGQMIGSVGNSGDARGGPTHLHFEIRREWAPFDPYPELVSVDPDATPPASPAP